jgi:hypothetical protein
LNNKEYNLKELLTKLITAPENANEFDIFMTYELESISKFDPNIETLKPEEVDLYIDMDRKPHFSVFENAFKVEIREELKEYWSQFWCPSFTVVNEKAITKHHDDKNIFVNLLKSPECLEEMIEDIEMYTEEMNEMGIEGLFFPIAFKEDGWNILFNNKDGKIYIQEHDPIECSKIADSIKDFYS